MAELYALSNVTRRFGDREVLNIASLRLEPGLIYGLLGPNGAGKTTLMRLLSFMDTPTTGSISFMGRKIMTDEAARCRARVVWVPQSPVMFTGTLLYNIEYPMRLKGMAGRERRAKALELLKTVDLARLAASPAHRLSGGEAQRASIARALAAGAEVILFDEPTASVDFRSRSEILHLIRELNEKRGLSVIVTTHDAYLAEELCRERIVLFDGKIVPSYPGSGLAPVAPLRQNELLSSFAFTHGLMWGRVDKNQEMDARMKLAVKLFLSQDDSFTLGPGRLDLLRTVKELGSLRKAAAKLGMSYRWAWGRINKAEEQLGFSLLIRTEEPVGGRPMVLTPEAEELLAWFAGVEKDLAMALSRVDKTMPAFLANVPATAGSKKTGPVLD